MFVKLLLHTTQKYTYFPESLLVEKNSGEFTIPWYNVDPGEFTMARPVIVKFKRIIPSADRSIVGL